MSGRGLGGTIVVVMFVIFASIASTKDKNTLLIAQQKGVDGMIHARGTFDVKVSPLPLEGAASDSSLGRMSLDKQFHGDLEANSQGEMLTAGTHVKGSGAYVALERVTGTLNGKSGAFTLQHSGTMTQGEPKLTVILGRAS